MPEFEEHYDLISEVIYPLHDDKRSNKRFFGDGKSRICASCGKSAPEVTFRKVAHVLPAAMGNRRLFSLEDCDACNEAGSLWENDLASMFAPQRIMGRVRNRDGWPTLAPNGVSSIKAVSHGELRIDGHESDPSVSLEKTNECEAVLTLSSPPCAPISAALALLRSFWLTLLPTQRNSLPAIRDILRVGSVTNSQLFSFVVPRAFDLVRLSGWRKKATPLPGASFALQFVFFDTVLVWLAPSDDVPSLLPPFETSLGEIYATEYLVADGNVNVKGSRSIRYHLSSDVRTDGQVIDSTATTSQRRTPIPVILEATTANSASSIRSSLEIRAWDTTKRELRISGGMFPGFMSLSFPDIDEENALSIVGQFSFRFFSHTMPPREASTAAIFLENMIKSGTLHIRSVETGATIFKATLRAGGLEPPPHLALLRDLALIQEKLNLDIRIPKDRSNHFTREVRYVASVLREGVAQSAGGTVTIALLPAEAASIEQRFETARSDEGPKLTLGGARLTAVIEGHQIDLGECTQEFFVRSVRRTGKLLGDDPLLQGEEVELQFSHSVERFFDWALGSEPARSDPRAP